MNMVAVTTYKARTFFIWLFIYQWLMYFGLHWKKQGINFCIRPKHLSIARDAVFIHRKYCIKQRCAIYKSVKMHTIFFIPKYTWNSKIFRTG